ncbi:unnamed protein product [Symbiodinium sp. KB8]|nr:unnamed protein product [Symbiodinium sp. KB8]
MQEVNILRCLDHPAIARVLDIFEALGSWIQELEYRLGLGIYMARRMADATRQRNGHELASLRNIILDLLLSREAFAAIRIGHHPLFLQKAIEDENASQFLGVPEKVECLMLHQYEGLGYNDLNIPALQQVYNRKEGGPFNVPDAPPYARIQQPDSAEGEQPDLYDGGDAGGFVLELHQQPDRRLGSGRGEREHCGHDPRGGWLPLSLRPLPHHRERGRHHGGAPEDQGHDPARPRKLATRTDPETEYAYHGQPQEPESAKKRIAEAEEAHFIEERVRSERETKRRTLNTNDADVKPYYQLWQNGQMP